MIVLDASVVVEMLLNGPFAPAIREALASRAGETFLVPHLVDIEVVSALRNLTAGGRLDSHRATQLLDALGALPAERVPHGPLAPRIWELRHNFTAYDAAYIALAEAANATLFTRDAKLSKGHRADVLVFLPA